MESYVTVDEVRAWLEKVPDRNYDPCHGGGAEWNFRKEKACDEACRLLDLFRDAIDRGTIVSENPLAWPRKRLVGS